jgi:glycosyltransferase involved in cell wall biosynthesis
MLVFSSDTYPPHRVDVAVLFGQELARRGFSVDWVLQSARANRVAQARDWGGGTVWVGPTDGGASRLHRLRKHWLALRHEMSHLKLAQAHRYDIIQVKDQTLIALPALRDARRRGARFVYWLSFPHPEASTYLARIGSARYPLLYRLRGWMLFQLLYRVILPRADHVFVQSEQMKRDLAGYGIDPAKMTPVPMGVSLSDFDGLDPQLPTGAGATIGYLGTLAGERRMDFLVRCLAIVLQSRADARLLLVGGGDRPGDEEAIRAEAVRLGISDRVEITGRLPRHDALQRIAVADVCVSPFYPTPILNSTSPTKLVEYMALRRPVVANDHPEQRLVIEESGAGYCVPYDETAFAHAILRVLADPVAAAAMGVRGRRYVEEHRSYPRIADGLAQQYRALANVEPVETKARH